jgi:tetratricopeptide (TPR) repeat protein
MLVDNLSSTSEMAHMSGDIELAEKYALEAQAESQRIGNTWNLAYSSGLLMQIYIQLGEIERALEKADQTRQLSEQSGFVVAAHLADIGQAQLMGDFGMPEHGLAIMDGLLSRGTFPFLEVWQTGVVTYLQLLKHNLPQARASFERLIAEEKPDDFSTYGPLYRALCETELALQEGRFEAARGTAAGMAEILRGLGIYYFLPELVFQQARAYIGLGDLENADLLLRQAEAIARECKHRNLLWQVLAGRAGLETRCGNLELAGALRREAREIVEWIAAHTPDAPAFGIPGSLRASFLALPQVQALASG